MAIVLKPIELPSSIDEHAVELAALKASRLDLNDKIDNKEAEIVKLAERNGNVPSGAAKSLRLEGDTYIITVTFGQSTSVDHEAVGSVQAALAEERKPGLFRKLFHAKTSYIVAPTAQAALESCSAKVRKLFGRVLKAKARKPSVAVERRKK